MTARIALLSRYVKGSRLVELNNRAGKKAQENLPPVLYHGTTRYSVEFWQKAGVQSRALSLAGDPTYAAGFATYFVNQKPLQEYGVMELGNDRGRRIVVSQIIVERFSLEAEYERLMQGRIIQAVAFFDRDTLLAGEGKDFELESEFDWNAGLVIKGSRDPEKVFEAVFAALYYDIENESAEFKIFNPYLWKSNFSIRPSPIGNLEKLIPPSRHKEMRRTDLGMYVLAKKLFLGVVIGRPNQKFLGVRDG